MCSGFVGRAVVKGVFRVVKGMFRLCRKISGEGYVPVVKEDQW